jgi:peptide/nickel transport system permease protein
MDLAQPNPATAVRRWSRRLPGPLSTVLRMRTLSAGAAILAVFLLCAMLAGVISPYDPDDVDYEATLSPPTAAHWFGTDDHGRDIFSRVVYGTRVSFAIAALAVGLASLLGIPTGLVSGYLGGWVDGVIGRALDALFAFPVILMAIAVVAILGTGERSAMIAIGLIAVPEFARVARGAMIAEKEREYVFAARALGAAWGRVVFRSILPNTVGPILVLISLGFAFAILNETALSFLGLGAQPPTPSWGADLATGRRYLVKAPWYSFFPGLAIFLLVLGLNLTGDGLRDLIDPRHRRR